MSSRKISNLTKKKIASSQEWKCKKCCLLLDECYEIDHIICVKDGGTNEESNLQALCPNCHRKKTNSDISKPKKETKLSKDKTSLPVWWNEYIEHPERQGRFVSNIVKHTYPNLVWNKDITNYNKYTVDELKIMLASINGKVKNGTKKEIMSFVGLGPYDIIVLPKWIHFGTYEFYRFKDGKAAVCRGDYIEPIKELDN